MKPMLPCLKQRNRYIAFEIVSKSRINDFKVLNSAIWASSLGFLGEIGLAQANLRCLKDNWNPQKQRGIIKVTNKFINKAIISLSLIKKINNNDVIINTLKTSGVINKLKKQYIAKGG